MRSYLRMDAAALPSAIGANQPDGSRVSEGTAGHLSFGPYICLSPGEYTAGFYLRRVGAIDIGSLTMDVVGGRGMIEFGKRSIAVDELMTSIAGLVSVDIEVQEDAYDVEVRLWVPDRIQVELQRLVVFRRRTLDWGL